MLVYLTTCVTEKAVHSIAYLSAYRKCSIAIGNSSGFRNTKQMLRLRSKIAGIFRLILKVAQICIQEINH